MKRIYSTVTLLSLLLAGCANATQPLTESLLWRVSGNGLESPSYLFGTHHFASTDLTADYPSLDTALGSAGQIVGEIDAESMATAQMAAMQYGMMPPGVTYRDLLSDENYAALDNYLTDNLGAGLDQFGNFKPAMISNMYVVRLYMAADPGFNPMSHEPIDTYIQKIGQQKGKKIVGLETVEEQMDLLMNFEPLEVQVQSLLCTFENEDRSVESILKLNELYREGKLQEMYDTALHNTDDPCPASEEFELALLTRRNENWLAVLPGIMAESPAVVAVGALHLAGEGGLVNRLREMGYTVEPIK